MPCVYLKKILWGTGTRVMSQKKIGTRGGGGGSFDGLLFISIYFPAIFSILNFR